MDIDMDSYVNELLQDFISEYKQTYDQLVQRERIEDETAVKEYQENDEELAQFVEEVQDTHFDMQAEGTSLRGEIITSGSMFDTITTEGKGESYSGGTNGVVTYPDEHTEPSPVPIQMQGQPVPNSADPPSLWKENAKIKIQSLLPGDLSEYVKSRLGEKIAPAIGELLSKQLAGGVA